jgi:quercetin 2,3-dioxygenase
MSLRPVKQIIETKPTIEGAGVKLQRAFGFRQDQGVRSVPVAGRFPQRESGGLPGRISVASAPRHRDHHLRAGRRGGARRQPGQQGPHDAGDVQWMTAGSGILHQEMPQGRCAGPHARVPVVGQPARGAEDDRSALSGHSVERHSRGDRGRWHASAHHLRRVLGQARAGGGRGDGIADPRYVDISVPPGKRKRIKVETTRNAFAYVFAGGNLPRCFGPAGCADRVGRRPECAPVYDAKNHSLVLFDRGDEIVVQAGPEGIRFLLVSGKPLEEPVAWYGPIVMNTQAELRQAMSELQTGSSSGTVIRRGAN